MVDGQVGFFRPENVRRTSIEKHNTIVRQIEKTRNELFPDLYQLQQDRLRELVAERKEATKLAAAEQRRIKEEAINAAKAKSYDVIMRTENMTKNTDLKATADATAAEEYEDDLF